MNDIHTPTIKACLRGLNDHLLSASHDVSLALEAKPNNEAIGTIVHLEEKLNLALHLCHAAIACHRLK